MIQPDPDDEWYLAHEQLRHFGWADAGIARLEQVRARNAHADGELPPAELTQESKRLAFWKHEREAGRLTDGELSEHAETWKQLVDVTAPAPTEADR